MRTAVIALLLALGGVLASEPAEAHGRARLSIGVGFGYPFWGPAYWSPWYYPPPYYYYPSPVVVRSDPVTYIEQGSSQSVEQSGGGSWWYYCDTTKGYYPYVKECPAGWLRVSPTPAK